MLHILPLFILPVTIISLTFPPSSQCLSLISHLPHLLFSPPSSPIPPPPHSLLTQQGCMHSLMCLPHSIRLLYVHSLCSLLWNHLTTYRLREYGEQVEEGDLVLHHLEGKTLRLLLPPPPYPPIHFPTLHYYAQQASEYFLSLLPLFNLPSCLLLMPHFFWWAPGRVYTF